MKHKFIVLRVIFIFIIVNNYLFAEYKDNNSNFWIGEYTLTLDIFRMNEEHHIVMNFIINSLENIDVIIKVDGKTKSTFKCKGIDKIEKLEIISSSEDKNKKEYIIIKDDNEYSITGQSIYLLNPPNDEYEIIKIK